MGDFDIGTTADQFWQNRSEGIYYPKEWEDRLTIDQAYALQLAILEKRISTGESQLGWKVGLTAVPIQQQMGHHEPVFGYLMADAPNPSGVNIDFDSITSPGFENELCLTMDRDLKGPGVTEQDALSAIRTVQPALELVESRGNLKGQLALGVVDNIEQKGIVLGQSTPIGNLRDMANIGLIVEINGETIAEASSSAVLGNPIRSIVWLCNKLAQFGYHLKAGQPIMTGSFTRQFPVQKGDSVSSTFDEIGNVSARFV
jgi:2-keto-4-pentenoate hydratase